MIYERFRLENQLSFIKKHDLAKTGKKLARLQIITMSCLVLFSAIVSYFFWGGLYAKSVIVGGIVAIVPNIVFAIKAFQYAGAQSSKQVMESFYKGEKLKLVFTALLFALAFKLLVIMPLPFFISFCLVVLVPLLTPFLFKL